MKCKVCEREFEATIDNHYVSRDITKTGVFANLVQHDEEKIFDTFDCPFCGCQNTVQERKRTFIDVGIDVDDVKELLEEDEEAGLVPKDSVEDYTNKNEELLKTDIVDELCWSNEFDIVQCIGCDNYSNCKKIAEAGEIDLEEESERDKQEA